MSHTRSTTDGPDFCAECSEALHDWVPWACPHIVMRERLERILRARTYDRHAYDEETFGELLDERTEATKVDAVVAHRDHWAPTVYDTPAGWTESGATAYRMAMEWSVGLLAGTNP